MVNILIFVMTAKRRKKPAKKKKKKKKKKGFVRWKMMTIRCLYPSTLRHTASIRLRTPMEYDAEDGEVVLHVDELDVANICEIADVGKSEEQ